MYVVISTIKVFIPGTKIKSPDYFTSIAILWDYLHVVGIWPPTVAIITTWYVCIRITAPIATKRTVTVTVLLYEIITRGSIYELCNET